MTSYVELITFWGSGCVFIQLIACFHVCVRDFSGLEFTLSAADFLCFVNVQSEKTKLFYHIKLGEASLRKGKFGTMSKVRERDGGDFFLRNVPILI